jgi:hypothetical protein
MDPLSISASVAGFLGLAIELKRIISTYVSDVKSAPQEAHELSVEVSALSHVLETLDELLQGEDLDETSFGRQSILHSVVSACHEHFLVIRKRLSNLRGKKVKGIMARIAWPLQKEECQQSILVLHRYVQTVEVLLIASNRLVSVSC